MKPGPHPGPGPLGEPAESSHLRQAEARRQLVPYAPGGSHEDDRSEHLPVTPSAPTPAVWPLGRRRNHALEQLPQILRHHPLTERSCHHSRPSQGHTKRNGFFVWRGLCSYWRGTAATGEALREDLLPDFSQPRGVAGRPGGGAPADLRAALGAFPDLPFPGPRAPSPHTRPTVNCAATWVKRARRQVLTHVGWTSVRLRGARSWYSERGPANKRGLVRLSRVVKPTSCSHGHQRDGSRRAFPKEAGR